MIGAARSRSLRWVVAQLCECNVGMANEVVRGVSTSRATSAIGALAFQRAVAAESQSARLRLPSGWRSWSAAAAAEQAPKQGNKDVNKAQEGKKEDVFLELTDENIKALTDKIPQRPMGVVEGTSYSLVIVAAVGVLGFFAYQFVTNFVLEPVAMQCFNTALERLSADPRVTVRLGKADDLRAFGSMAETRLGRQQIPHQVYKDAGGKEHCRLQFHMKGPGGTALVNADMYKDEQRTWQYTYLLVDFYVGGSASPQRVHIVSPK